MKLNVFTEGTVESIRIKKNKKGKLTAFVDILVSDEIENGIIFDYAYDIKAGDIVNFKASRFGDCSLIFDVK